MDTLSRKLFKSRDARTKLRGMGGILASSPELSQTVQRFQKGGDIQLKRGGYPDDLSRTVGQAIRYNRSNEQGTGTNLTGNVIDAYLRGELDPSSKAYRDMVRFEQANGRDMLREIASQIADPYGQSPYYSSRDEITPRMSQEDAMATRRRLAGDAGIGSVSADVEDFAATPTFGTNVEYTYSTYLAENNLNDTPQAREMFARYKSLMDTREPLTDPQLFSPVGFDRAPSALGDAPMTRAVEFDPNRQYSRPDMPSAPAELSEIGTEIPYVSQTSPAAPPLSTLDQLRSSVYSTNPLEDALAGTGLDSNVIGTSVVDPIMNRLDQAASREGMPSPTAADVAAEVALRNRERASENAGRLTAEELMASDPVRPGAAPELTADELAMQAYGESLGQQYAPIGERSIRMDDAVSELAQQLVAPKVGSEAVTFPGAEGRAIMRGDLTAAEMMPPPPRALDLPAEERRMDYVTEGETPVVEAPETGTAADADTDTDTAAPVVTEEVVKKVADPKIQEEAAALAPAPDDTEDDIRTKYEARAKLFREILGEDEAGARNKGMDLAMIGLAIMSGQSPNALTNIGQGTLSGLQAMSAQDEAARERQRLVRTTALESVLAEEAASAAADATAAEKEADRLNRLAVAETNAAGRSSLYADDDRTYEVAAEAARARASDPLFPPADFLESDTIESYSKRAGDAAVRYKNESRAAGLGSSAVPIGKRIQDRVDAAKDNPAALAAIKQSLISKGIDPSTYGIK